MLITIRTQGQAVRPVEFSSTVTEVRRAAPFVVQAPKPVPAGWVATSVNYDPPEVTGKPGIANWHLGFYTSQQQYAALEQTNAGLQDLLEQQVPDAVKGSTETIDGQQWQRWDNSTTVASNVRRALVTTEGTGLKGSVVMVTGTAGWPELEQLAGSLSGV